MAIEGQIYHWTQTDLFGFGWLKGDNFEVGNVLMIEEWCLLNNLIELFKVVDIANWNIFSIYFQCYVFDFLWSMNDQMKLSGGKFLTEYKFANHGPLPIIYNSPYKSSLAWAKNSKGTEGAGIPIASSKLCKFIQSLTSTQHFMVVLASLWMLKYVETKGPFQLSKCMKVLITLCLEGSRAPPRYTKLFSPLYWIRFSCLSEGTHQKKKHFFRTLN